MKVVIHSNESLVFRDGRPFGDAGHINGGALRWPQPFTVTGLLRNRVGMSRASDYFSGPQRKQNIAEIKKVTAAGIFPLWRDLTDNNNWAQLFPAPADMMVFPAPAEPSSAKANPAGEIYRIEAFNYIDPFTQGGIDLPWKNWLLPVSNSREKPAANPPELWHKEPFFTWLEKGALPKTIKTWELGLNLPQTELRMHTAINSETGSVSTGQLFSSQGISFLTAADKHRKAGRFGIGVELKNLKDGDDPTGPCFFGGERKTARIDTISENSSAFLSLVPDWLNQKARYLRLILLSPGDFSAWAPDWLRPDPDTNETAWVKIPASELEIRLVSAFIPRWQPVSGWDYDKGGPKATRKLVPAGAVYIIELKDPEKAPAVAKLLWGRSLNDNLEDADGCGCLCVGQIPQLQNN